MTNDDKPKNLEKSYFFVNTSDVHVSNSCPETPTFNLIDLPPPPPLCLQRQYTFYSNCEINDNLSKNHKDDIISTISAKLLETYIVPHVEREQFVVSNDQNIDNMETWDMEDLLLGKDIPTHSNYL
ncbi:hypothetical protein phytr_2860 [Candidatus Phycorickettsia trachydisci]|uniref:Uncharacterized protein n=1 Tax=Candidatus Phycorickettsia trachydisci TaxID=2115978 RepID=A0A2P1P7K1_9RICK|nr:hypothetical protein [Candidatus Phycorickettsia trachydisci]AVP87242.1 hypothetical protein phytr_2860 [Candidatus Phycorickettsia trachydisci]